MRKGRMLHDSVLVMISVILVMIVFAGMVVYFDLTGFIGRIVAEAGNVTRLDVNKQEPASWWDGIYGRLTTLQGASNYTVTGGSVAALNLTVLDIGYFLKPSMNIYAGTVKSINFSALVPANTTEVDSFMGISPSDPLSATSTFVNKTNFTVNNVSMELYSTFTNSPDEKFDLGILKDKNTGEIVFVTHVKPNGTSFNGNTADYQMMLPLKNASSTLYYLSVGEQECSFSIVFANGRNWFSIPCITSDTRIDVVLSDLGKGAGTEHETWALPGCTGNPNDNYKGNYTIIWT
ncbi:hypothetical protein D6764_02285, partial [Candidatus Woesearchaeota archaeon]